MGGILDLSQIERLSTYSWARMERNSRKNGWYPEEHSPSNVEASTSRKRMVVICVQVCRSHDERKVLGRPWQYPLFGQLVGIWTGHDKDQAKSLDDRGAVGYLLDIDIWQSGATRIMEDGIVIKAWRLSSWIP